MLVEITDSAGEPTDRLKFISREYSAGRTVFSFYPYRTGSYTIDIRKTDYAEGAVEHRRFALDVVDGLPAVPETSGLTAGEAPAEMAESPEAGAEPEGRKYTSGNLLDAAERLADAGDCSAAAGLLENSIDQLDWSEQDAALFILAGYYENCPEIRDERRAAEVYSRIVDYYPVSIYWEDSKDRKIYLERNFIHIR